MKKSEKMKLNNESFEVITSRMHPVAPITGCNRGDIYEVYSRPSQRKVNIWDYWCDWCNAMNDSGWECGIQIESHNINFFTITGSLRGNGDTYDLWITASHNRLYKHYPL